MRTAAKAASVAKAKRSAEGEQAGSGGEREGGDERRTEVLRVEKCSGGAAFKEARVVEANEPNRVIADPQRAATSGRLPSLDRQLEVIIAAIQLSVTGSVEPMSTLLRRKSIGVCIMFHAGRAGTR